MTRAAVVTGGGSGIGAAVVHALTQRGVATALVGRRPERLLAIVDEVTKLGGSAIAIPIDIGDEEAAGRIVRSAIDAFGQLDILINNAATMTLTPFDEVSVDVFDAHVAVNLRAPYFLTQAALPALRRSAAPAVVNIGSAAASLYRPGQSVYGSTKAALEYLTKSLAVELAPERIRVNAVVPGPVDTPMHTSGEGDVGTIYASLANAIPLGRMGTAQEIAWWVAQLTEPEADWVTGAIVRIDGGRTLAPPDVPRLSSGDGPTWVS